MCHPYASIREVHTMNVISVMYILVSTISIPLTAKIERSERQTHQIVFSVTIWFLCTFTLGKRGYSSWRDPTNSSFTLLCFAKSWRVWLCLLLFKFYSSYFASQTSPASCCWQQPRRDSQLGWSHRELSSLGVPCPARHETEHSAGAHHKE